MNDDNTLPKKTREALRRGKLPDRMPDRSWGGRGLGAACWICGELIRDEQLELELEFDHEDDQVPHNYHVHVQCFSAWRRERFMAERRAARAPHREDAPPERSVRDARPPQVDPAP